MVSEQIQELLHAHDCVIIPDFGGLIAQYAPARIHPVKHTVTPPSKKIAFNEKLKHNDGLLISGLSQHLRVPLAEAQQLVSQFVNGLQQDLNQTQKCELKGIGIFRYNAEHKIEFEYLAAENFLENSFGLPELTAKPIIPAEAAALRAMRYQKPRPETTVSKNKLNRFIDKYATVAGTVLLGGLTVSLIYLVSLQTDYNLSSLNPAALFQQNTQTAEVTETPKSEKTVAISSENPYRSNPVSVAEMPVTPEEVSVKAVEEDYNKQLKAEEIAVAEVTKEKPAAPISIPAAKPVVKAENSIAKPEKLAVPVAKVTPAPAKAAEVPAKKIAVLPAVKPVTPVVAKVAVVNKTENKTTNTIKAKTGRFFVICGGYLSKVNAERSSQEFKNKGAETEIISPGAGSKLHRVAIAEFETMETASAQMPALRKKYGNALWILNY